MNMKISLVLMMGLSLVGVACGSTGSGGTTSGGGAGHGGEGATSGGGMGGAAATTTSSTTAAGTTAATGSGGGTGLEAPMIKSVEPLEGALHVMWMNVTMDCDKIELSRKHDAGAYAVAYTLTGSATSQHDMQAVPPGMYCYKARCLKGAQASPDSNEMCGTP